MNRHQGQGGRKWLGWCLLAAGLVLVSVVLAPGSWSASEPALAVDTGEAGAAEELRADSLGTEAKAESPGKPVEAVASRAVVVEQGVEVSGRVVTESGGGIAGCEVVLEPVRSKAGFDPKDAIRRTETGADGAFRLTLPQTVGRLCRIRFSAAAYLTLKYVVPSGSVEVPGDMGRITLPTPLFIDVAVHDEAGVRQPVVVTVKRVSGGIASGSDPLVSSTGCEFLSHGHRMSSATQLILFRSRWDLGGRRDSHGGKTVDLTCSTRLVLW